MAALQVKNEAKHDIYYILPPQMVTIYLNNNRKRGCASIYYTFRINVISGESSVTSIGTWEILVNIFFWRFLCKIRSFS